MRIITDVIVHCAATPTGKHFTVGDIDSWHRQRGFRRSKGFRSTWNPLLGSIGYHYIIYVDGSLHTGRNLEEIGAHCEGNNAHSIGVCLIGTDKFTVAQWTRLEQLLKELRDKYPGIRITGHCDWESAKKHGKTCPNFDVEQYVSNFTVPQRNLT